MQEQYILFDLDGTLTDPGEGITKCVAFALSHFGIAVEDLTQLHPFIGPPLRYSFQTFYGLNEEDTLQAIRLYRQRFAQVGWQENILYPGIESLLSALVQQGKTLLVATSKPEVFALKILEHFGLAKYFTVICGAPMDENSRSTKATVIADAMQRANITKEDGLIMVGDRLHDIEGAHENGIPAIGVLYGYGDRAEHEAYGADWIAPTVDALKAFLISHRKDQTYGSL